MRVTMYSSSGCHLCDAAGDVIRRVRNRRGFEFEVVMIDGDPDLEARFRSEIPVVHINGRFAFRYRVDAIELVREIEGARIGGSWNT
jgi:glutaredoxin